MQRQSSLSQSASGINISGSMGELKIKMDFLKEQYERHKMNKQV